MNYMALTYNFAASGRSHSHRANMQPLGQPDHFSRDRPTLPLGAPIASRMSRPLHPTPGDRRDPCTLGTTPAPSPSPSIGPPAWMQATSKFTLLPHCNRILTAAATFPPVAMMSEISFLSDLIFLYSTKGLGRTTFPSYTLESQFLFSLFYAFSFTLCTGVFFFLK